MCCRVLFLVLRCVSVAIKHFIAGGFFFLFAPPKLHIDLLCFLYFYFCPFSFNFLIFLLFFFFCKSFISFKFAKYQRIYRRNISVGNLRSKLLTDTFPSVIQSVTTDELFSVRNSVGNYRRKISVGSYRLNYGRKSFWIKKKGGSLTWRFWRVIFFRRIQKDSPYSDVTSSPFKLPTDSPRDLKWQIHTVTCLCVC